MPLQASNGDRVSRKSEVGLGLAAAGGEEQQLGLALEQRPSVGVRVGGVRQAGKAEQDEGQLERPPAPVLRFVELVEEGRRVGGWVTGALAD